MRQIFLNINKIVLGIVFISFLPTKSYAWDFFVVLDAMQMDSQVAGIGFESRLARFGAGVFFMEGVALELQANFASDVGDSKVAGVASEIDALRIASLRFQSPYDVGYSAFVKLGYAQFDLLTFNNSMPENILQEELSSGYFSVGLQKQVDRWPRLGYALSYEHLYRDERVRIRSLSFGYSYLF